MITTIIKKQTDTYGNTLKLVHLNKRKDEYQVLYVKPGFTRHTKLGLSWKNKKIAEQQYESYKIQYLLDDS
jgi:hypothetical protein